MLSFKFTGTLLFVESLGGSTCNCNRLKLLIGSVSISLKLLIGSVLISLKLLIESISISSKLLESIAGLFI